MSQNAVLPETGAAAAEVLLSVDAGLGGSEHAVMKRTAAITADLRQLPDIPSPRMQAQYGANSMPFKAEIDRIMRNKCFHGFVIPMDGPAAAGDPEGSCGFL
jgi:hypothetical protein